MFMFASDKIVARSAFIGTKGSICSIGYSGRDGCHEGWY
jgi:hypothetical protein